jgi:hypothetical protein
MDCNNIDVGNIPPETVAQIVKQHVLPMFQPPRRTAGRKFNSSSNFLKDFNSGKS